MAEENTILNPNNTQEPVQEDPTLEQIINSPAPQIHNPADSLVNESASIISQNIAPAEEAASQQINQPIEQPTEQPKSPLSSFFHFKKMSPPPKKFKPDEAIFHIETDKIKPNPFQPRRDFNEESLKELAASIREFGILQPLVITKIEKDTETGTQVEYQLIAGERRLMAAKLLGWERVPAIVKQIDQKALQLQMAIVENLQRSNLNPIETARAYSRLQDEFGLTQREIASRLGKSRETVANTVRLLNLPTEIQNAVAESRINESQARLLLTISEPAEQINLFQQLLANNLSVRELKLRIRRAKPQGAPEPKSTALLAADPEMISLQEKLTELLGAKVKIEKEEQGGKIIITFYSPEEIKGIIDKLGH